ncbi:hypothetical protein CC79DRAFT_1331706 [Sarocladium strictum]
MDSRPVPLNQEPTVGSSIATPDNGHGVFTVSCSTLINASPQKCLEIVLDGPKYPDWNNFCTKVTIDHVPTATESKWDAPPELKHLLTQEGALFPDVDFHFDCVMKVGDAPRKVSLRVTRLEAITQDGRKGYRVAWTMPGGRSLMMRAERVQEFVATEDGLRTEYCCYETFGGVLSYPARYFVSGQVADGFGRWMDGLKKKAEEQ